MKVSSVVQLKEGLQSLPPKHLLELCLRLIKFKKENKELVHYLLFELPDPQYFIETVKNEINDAFWNLPRSTPYQIKKGLRKILKLISRYSKYTGNKEIEVEFLFHFCLNLINSGLRYRSNKSLASLFDQQIKKIESLISKLEEDLRIDFQKRLEDIK